MSKYEDMQRIEHLRHLETDKEIVNIDNIKEQRPALHTRYSDALCSIKKCLSTTSKILDIGCRGGLLMSYFINHGYKNIEGIDLLEDGLKLAESRGLSVSQCDMHNLGIFEDMSFDAVISTHSLEHCWDPRTALEEIHRILKNDGILYIEVPGIKKGKIKNRNGIKLGNTNEELFIMDELVDIMDGLYNVVDIKYIDYGKGKGGSVIQCLLEKLKK